MNDTNARITRDSHEAMIVIDGCGRILLLNPAAVKTLGLQQSADHYQNYSEILEETADGRNDPFHQMLINAVSQHDVVHNKVPFFTCEGKKRMFNVACSALYSADGTEVEGAIFNIQDCTLEEYQRLQIRNSLTIWLILLLGACLWDFHSASWAFFGYPFSKDTISWHLIILSMILATVAIYFTQTPLSQCGLGRYKLRRNLIEGIIVTLVGLVGMIGIKKIMIACGSDFFADKPFFDWTYFTMWGAWAYPISVFIQEFISRGVMHESLRRLIPKTWGEWPPIVISSIFFGALHIHLGLAFMVGAALLLSLLGVFYLHQRSIWGLCIPHLILGYALLVLGFAPSMQ